jgi:hypothetical protein
MDDQHFDLDRLICAQHSASKCASSYPADPEYITMETTQISKQADPVFKNDNSPSRHEVNCQRPFDRNSVAGQQVTNQQLSNLRPSEGRASVPARQWLRAIGRGCWI